MRCWTWSCCRRWTGSWRPQKWPGSMEFSCMRRVYFRGSLDVFKHACVRKAGSDRIFHFYRRFETFIRFYVFWNILHTFTEVLKRSNPSKFNAILKPIITLIFQVLTRGSQYRIESMMLRLAHSLGYIAPSVTKSQRSRSDLYSWPRSLQYHQNCSFSYDNFSLFLLIFSFINYSYHRLQDYCSSV